MGQTLIYLVLVIIIFAFLFFIINTIRCYLSRPKFDDQDDQQQIRPIT